MYFEFLSCEMNYSKNDANNVMTFLAVFFKKSFSIGLSLVIYLTAQEYKAHGKN